MFAKNGDIYTVHEKPDTKEPSDRIVLVREGFAFWAFIFTVFWLVYHRCWRMAIVCLLMLLAVDRAVYELELTRYAELVLQFGLQFWIGGIANDCYRAALQRKGYREVTVVCAESPLLAERRYFDRLQHAA